MARITLNAKLKKRPDYNEIVKKVKLHPKPIKYVESTFGVTYLTAKKFVDELQGFKVSVDNKELDATEAKAELFLNKVNVRFNPNYNPSSLTFALVGEELEKIPPIVLKCIFKKLHGSESKDVNKFILIRGIKYLLQKKYYNLIFKKDMPKHILDNTEQIIRDCVNA